MRPCRLSRQRQVLQQRHDPAPGNQGRRRQSLPSQIQRLEQRHRLRAVARLVQIFQDSRPPTLKEAQAAPRPSRLGEQRFGHGRCGVDQGGCCPYRCSPSSPRAPALKRSQRIGRRSACGPWCRSCRRSPAWLSCCPDAVCGQCSRLRPPRSSTFFAAGALSCRWRRPAV